jgi:8-hydroxy-5-deazaflavin:NADPH oxidoreductase
MTPTYRSIAIIGGTGAEGRGLAIRWARFGHTVIIGSRDEAKAKSVSAEINRKLGIETVRGLLSRQAVKDCEIAVLSVP